MSSSSISPTDEATAPSSEPPTFVFVHPPFTGLDSIPVRMIGVATRIASSSSTTVEVTDANNACHRAWLDAPFLRGQMARMERVIHQLSQRAELTTDERT